MFKYIFLIVYILSAIFVFISLAIYEEPFVGTSNDWYSRDNMENYQYFSYVLTYMLSFPVGTVLSVFESEYLSNKWFFVFIPNLILFFYFFSKIEIIIKKRSNK
jgi:hypothetical protein